MDLRPRHRRFAPSLALLAACAAPLVCACDTTPTLKLSASPTSIGGDGESPVTLKATVTRGGAAVDSATVHFVVTGDNGLSPGLLDSAAAGTPGVADVATTAGDAVATLTVPRRGRGALGITASTSIDGVQVSQTQKVTLTPAGGLATRLDFFCATQNVGGLVTGRTEPIHVLCTAKAYSGNTEIKKASIEPFAEAGSLEWEKDQTGAQLLIYTIDPGTKPPLDVDPFDGTGKPQASCPAACIIDVTSAQCTGEPCWVENGVTHNPRDGVATLMVAVPGVAGFFDTVNAYGEPFVDANDDGVRQASETFIDVNGNGKYDDSSSGTKQDTRMLWKSVRIIWSGSADTSNTSHASKILGTASGTNLANGVLRVHDKNLNKLAATGAAGTDVAQLDASCTNNGSFDASPATIHLDQNGAEPGITFGSDESQPIVAPGSAASYRRKTEYVVNGSATVDSGSPHPQCTVQATLQRVYDPGAPGYSSNGDSSAEVVEGVVTF